MGRKTMDFEKEDKIVSDFLKSLGPWSSYIVITGGYAPIIYKIYFSDCTVGTPPVGTRDIDSLVPRKIPLISKENIASFLLKSGFQQSFRDYLNPATEFYKKNIEDVDVIVEFLTDDSVRIDKEKNVLIAGVVAQSLSYLKLSLENALPFFTLSGEKGFVVSPEAWIFNKGLAFPKRVDKKKIYKDLYGIWYVGSQLGNLSDQTIERLKNLSLKEPTWFKTFAKNLLTWQQEATPLDWLNLEKQDQFGNLRKIDFQMITEKILN